jgi:hypothetical protein
VPAAGARIDTGTKFAAALPAVVTLRGV